MDPTGTLHLQPSLRTLQPSALQALHPTQDGALHHHLQTLPPNLQGLDAIANSNESIFQQRYQLADHAQLHPSSPYGPQPQAVPYHVIPTTGYQHSTNQFNLIAQPPPRPTHQRHVRPPLPTQAPPPQQIPDLPVDPQTELVQQQELEGTPITSHGQFEGLRLIPDPPDLDAWRDKLFHVDNTITLTEDQFLTYFPHIDNVYSHRSTQRHKRKRFVSHYWDCRLKGRPPGTRKSTDPAIKKRKRVARERDLCDVKIKITEYFDGAELTDQTGQQPPVDTGLNGGGFTQQQINQWEMPRLGPTMGSHRPPSDGKKFYTLQRVNGNGGNGKADGVPGPHKHSLEESDRVKKNSVLRFFTKNERERKKKQGGDATKKSYHKKATGNALKTVQNHSKEDDLKLYGSCFCPFVQRVWISLEHKGIPYQYIEVDPYKKPQSLLDVNPRGLVPAIRHGPTWSTHESTVIMEYLEDLQRGRALLPPDAQTRATSRLWSDHVNRNIIPGFYRLLQAQNPDDQISHATELRNEITKLVDAADAQGPFFLGSEPSFVDVQIAPWVIRLKRVLGPYRGWPEPEEGTRWAKWVDAIENEKSVVDTTSDDGLYLDSYERYAENRPGTSQLANAVNEGRGLP